MEPVASRSDTSVSTVEATRRLVVPRPPEVKPLGMDGQQLRARLMTRAPAVSSNFNTITLGLNRVTKTQRLAIKRREPTRLEPLPTLMKYQEQQLPSYIQNENREILLDQDWPPRPGVQRPPTAEDDLRYGNEVTRMLIKKTDSAIFEMNDIREPKQKKPKMTRTASQLSMMVQKKKKDRKLKVGYDLDTLRKASLETILSYDIRDPQHVIDIVKNNDKVDYMYLTTCVHHSSNDYSPYNMKVVAHDKVRPDNYCTISVRGVTRIRDGEQEYTELDRWQYEYRLYCRLIAINTFKRFRLWKAFAVWRKNVRSNTMRSRAGQLQETLFYVNPVLRDAILNVKEMCCRISDMGMCRITRNHTYQLEEFTAAQYDQLAQVQARLLEFRDLVKEVVRNACRTALLEAGFTPDDYFLDADAPMLVPGLERPPDTAGSSLLIQSQMEDILGDGPDKMTYTEQANKRAHCKRLTGFIRLADYLIVATLHSLTTNSVMSLLSRFRLQNTNTPPDDEIMGWREQEIREVAEAAAAAAAAEKAKKEGGATPMFFGGDSDEEDDGKPAKTEPMFQLQLDITVPCLRFVPNYDAFQASVSGVMGRFQETVLQVVNLVSDDYFNAFTRPSINGMFEEKTCGEGPKLSTVFDDDKHLRYLMADTKENMKTAFKSANVYMKSLGPVHAFYAENDGLDEAALREDRGQDIEFFIEHLDRYYNQHEVAKAFKPQRDLGMLRVDGVAFKEKLVPNPMRCLKCIHDVLPQLAKRRMDGIIAEAEDAQFKLEQEPTTTQEYVESISFLDEFEQRVEVIDRQQDLVEKMYSLITQYKVPVPPEDLATYKIVNPTMGRLKDAIDKAVSERKENVRKFQVACLKDVNELKKEVRDMKSQVQNPMILDSTANHTKIKALVKEIMETFGEFQERAARYKSYQKGFKCEVSRFEELEAVHSEMRLKDLLWRSFDDWDNLYNSWLDVDFWELDPDPMNAEVTKFVKIATQVEKGLPPNDCIPMLREKILTMKDRMPFIVNLRNPLIKLRHWALVEAALGQHVPNPNMVTQSSGSGSGSTEESQEEGEEKVEEKLTLRRLVKWKAFDHTERIEEISGQASGEAALETMIKGVEANWKTLDFPVQNHRDSADVFILGVTEDIQMACDDSRITVSTILSSRYVGPIREKVEEWQRQLNLMNETLEEWLNCQRNWLYLESIFSAPDIQRQLPAEAKMFMQVDRTWKDIMRRVARLPNALRASTAPGLLESFQNNNALLDQIQKCLEMYLESKRVVFSRFYFLSNEELLEILAQTRNPLAVQPHLRKCFDAIASLEFGKQPGARPGDAVQFTNDIISMVSPEGEYVNLGKGLKARGNVEDWLCKVEEAMIVNLRKFAKAAIDDFMEKSREEWCTCWNSQAVLTISQMMWCGEVTNILAGNFSDPAEASGTAGSRSRSQADDDDDDEYEGYDDDDDDEYSESAVTSGKDSPSKSKSKSSKSKSLSHKSLSKSGDDDDESYEDEDDDEEEEEEEEEEEVELDPIVAGMKRFEQVNFDRLNSMAALVRTELPRLHRNNITALITIDVHARDIITDMCAKRVNTDNDFEWLRQLRYYWEPEIDDCVIRCAGSRYIYGYEYLGACPRLVITPLTDRCYLTLMGALQLDLGGAPAGPAGTGKTETTKDLAKALAKQCVVFNCSESLDYRVMGRFFSGLASSGAWACFDEFNRIDIEVLSVIAQQLLTIRNAKSAKQLRFMFEGREIKLDWQCAAFITMNPGYAGRTELPDNLAVLFRPISMMVPDYKLIAEVILYSEGFEGSQSLSLKMTQMYKLCSEQLSQQDHYDFGMRAVKSVLVMAGSLKRENPDIREDITLIRALRDSNLPKFLAQDAILFRAILTDLFPGVDIPEHDYGVFEATIKKCMRQRKLQPVSCIVKKVIQLYETMLVRHGVMLVGPTGGGKTVNYQVLADVLDDLYRNGHKNPAFKPVRTVVMNPKSITMGELYGEENPLTMEWKDGLMAISVRVAVQEANEGVTDHQWIICDGPVDALWIENMNTVLDDNKMLCMANSERIKLSDYIHMVFEVQDLAVASPATVSRCGMVYMDPTELGWRAYVSTWMEKEMQEKVTASTRNYIFDLFDAYVEDGLRYVEQKLNQLMQQSALSKVACLCSLLQSLLLGQKSIDIKDEGPKLRQIIGMAFIFSYTWSIAGNVDDECFDYFDTFARTIMEDNQELRMPNQSDLFSYYVDFESKKFEMWERSIVKYQYNPKMPFFDILVPTIDTTRFGYLMDKLLDVKHSVLFTGKTGVGKSVVARGLLESIAEPKNYVPLYMGFSAQTSSFRTQEFIEAKLERRGKKAIGAPKGKQVIIFVDDLNMPKLDTYGSQPPIELLRQYQDFRGLFDRDTMVWKDIEDVTICSACAPPGGGRNPVTPRFIRHFGMFALPSPSEINLKTIFTSILNGFLVEFEFEVKECGPKIVEAAIEIYTQMSTDLLPTPAKSHYVFNLRDLSKCVQGILRAQSDVIREKSHIFYLFCHEALRVFHDRLINEDDKNYFYKMLSEMAGKYFMTQIEPEEFANKPVIFGDFLNREERVYMDLTNSVDKTKMVLEEYLDDYNMSSSKEMRLVFFQDAIDHISRICRMITTQRGNALLVGVGGCGKQSLTRLACHVCGYKCYQIELTRGYNYDSFHEDLRNVFRLAGGHGHDTVFLFTDTQIVQEEFLEDINNILNSGEVANLFEKDELEQCLQLVRPHAKEAGIAEADRDAVYQFFISRVRQNLHIVLCMSPVGDAFRSRCRMFPSLVNCCTIDWFIQWPEEALMSVAQNFFDPVHDLDEKAKENLAHLCVQIHTSVNVMGDRFYEELRRYYYTTPTSYLELINLYLAMLGEKKKSLCLSRDRFKTGLQKLLETNQLVSELKQEMAELEPVLIKKSAETEELMERLAVDQEEADKVKQVVMEDEAVAKVKAEETQAIADEAQRDLDEAMPVLQKANKALDALDKSDITEIKGFVKPPEAVQTVMEAVCILYGAKTDWASAKVLLGDQNFLRKCVEFDKDNIKPSVIKKLVKYIKNPNFVPEKVEKVSKACRSLCMWIRAMYTYSLVIKEVEPKRQKLAAATEELEGVMSALKEKQQTLAEVEAKMAALQKTFDDSVDEKDRLIKSMALTQARMKRSGKLTTALGDEQVRWEQKIADYQLQIDNVVGDVFIAAACVAYYGAFTSVYREQLVTQWCQYCRDQNVAISDDTSLDEILGDSYEIRQWNSEGLPRDSVSTENAIMVTRARRWPLMIDPQDQANRWIRNKEQNFGLKVIKLTDGDFLRTLENCIRIGTPVLLEELQESLDPALEPILLKQTFTAGGRLLIRLGDTDVDYDKHFRFYMTTKMANPHYLPEICIKVTIINFTVTKLGLEDQILADVVRIERPDLEEQRSDLITTINADKAQQKEIEDEILKLLFASEGNILDNEALVNTLADSKVTSAIISDRLIEAEATEHNISVAREKYRIVATRGSVLFFVVASLGEIDPMYMFSLQYFNSIFNMTMQNTPKVDDLDKRLRQLLDETTKAIYRNVARGLFERHKLLFSFMMCVDIMRQDRKITDAEWNYFLRGAAAVEKQRAAKPKAEWLNDENWIKVTDLEDGIKGFKGLAQDMTRTHVFCALGELEIRLNPKKWAKYTHPDPPEYVPPKPKERKKVADDDEPPIEAKSSQESVESSKSKKSLSVEEASSVESVDTDKVIGHWEERLSMFQKLVLVKVFKEERVVASVTDFVMANIGREFVENPPISLHSLYADMTNLVPLVFVLSAGSDPMVAFLRFAKEMDMIDQLQAISLGQGQGPVAEKMMATARESGGWVFLQNCHLAKSFMPRLEEIFKKMKEMKKGVVHENYRLILSSMPAPFFPVTILQGSVKVTNEPPKGIKSNLRGAFASLDKSYFEDHALGLPWRKMIFGLCFFHAVIQERKKFGPLGWNKMYDFNDSDRECAILNLDLFCEDDYIPWDALVYITGEITYGGRVTDHIDKRCLCTVLQRFFNSGSVDFDYKYSESGVYFAPDVDTIEEYQDYINQLPIIDNPEIFAMHPNANLAFQRKETQQLVGTILEIQPRMSSGGEGKTPDDVVREMTESILAKLEVFTLDVNEAQPSMFKNDSKGRVNSLTTVLVQEIERFRKLLAVIIASLGTLKKAIAGLVVMSEQMEMIYRSFLNNWVPGMWSAAAYPSLKPLGSWVLDLQLRCGFTERWIRNGPPKSFWLSGLFFPQGFLTGSLQNHARRYNLPIDRLSFNFHPVPCFRDEAEYVKELEETPPGQTCKSDKQLPKIENGVLVHGLFTEGFRFDANKLIMLSEKDRIMNSKMVVMHMEPKMDFVPPKEDYICPLYKEGARAGVLSTTGHSTNFVVFVHLPTDQDPSFWVSRGSAMLCQLSK